MQFACMENDLICVRAPGATHRLILLHGWGADAEDLIPLGQELIKGIPEKKIELLSIRAPNKHPDGFGRQWYGLFPPDWSAVPSAVIDLQIRIKALCSTSISLEKTVMLGFSQGGAMAIASGSDLPMAGLIGCSAYPHPDWNPPEQSPPVLLVHGRQDEVVPYDAARKLLISFSTKKSDTDLVVFEGGHEIPPELLLNIQLFLEKWFV
jgi:phospholipase/carboxylesterase